MKTQHANEQGGTQASRSHTAQAGECTTQTARRKEQRSVFCSRSREARALGRHPPRAEKSGVVGRRIIRAQGVQHVGVPASGQYGDGIRRAPCFHNEKHVKLTGNPARERAGKHASVAEPQSASRGVHNADSTEEGAAERFLFL